MNKYYECKRADMHRIIFDLLCANDLWNPSKHGEYSTLSLYEYITFDKDGFDFNKYEDIVVAKQEYKKISLSKLMKLILNKSPPTITGEDETYVVKFKSKGIRVGC